MEDHRAGEVEVLLQPGVQGQGRSRGLEGELVEDHRAGEVEVLLQPGVQGQGRAGLTNIHPNIDLFKKSLKKNTKILKNTRFVHLKPRYSCR